MADDNVTWFAGIDWGSQTHQACLLDVAGEVVGERALGHGGTGLAAPDGADGDDRRGRGEPPGDAGGVQDGAREDQREAYAGGEGHAVLTAAPASAG